MGGLYMRNVFCFWQNCRKTAVDHPKYKDGLQQSDIVEILQQEKFANGDLSSQIETAVSSLEISGFIRYVDNGYRTFGPLAKLATAKTSRQRAKVWDTIQKEYSNI